MTDAMEAPSAHPWQDPVTPVAVRVSDLMSRMTLVEKVAQLSGLWGVDPEVGEMAPMLRDAMGGFTWRKGKWRLTAKSSVAATRRQSAKSGSWN